MSSTTDVQLPTVLPVLPGLVLSGQYAMTECEPTHRGDSLDACLLPRGRVAMLVADVVGHGFGAAVAAAQIRAILWSHLREGASLAEAVERLDRYAEHQSNLTASTLAVAVLDTEDGTLEYSAAGLLPPLVLTPHETPRIPGAALMQPLGTGGTVHVQRTVLRPDDMVVLSTNGFVNAPGKGLQQSSDELGSLAALALDKSTGRGSTAPQRADDVARALISGHLPAEPCDDVALLVAQRMPFPDRLSVTLDAATFDVSELRGILSAWLDGFGAGLVDHISVGHALVELVTNAVKHAYRVEATHERPIEIDATLDESGDVIATVADRGRWRTPEDQRGRGLAMTGGLMDSVLVQPSPEGTVVEIRSHLGRPVQLWQSEPGPPEETDTALPDELSAVVVSGVLTASGPVDEASADLFHAALIEATHAGTANATVDLTAVTHLSSPGVQSLFDVINRSSTSGVSMNIVAPRSTPVRQILDLVGLPATP